MSINIPSLCINILHTGTQSNTVIFCQQQTTEHPFNDRGFILRSIEAWPAVVLRHANEALCNNERWLVTTHLTSDAWCYPGADTGPACTGHIGAEREEEGRGVSRSVASGQNTTGKTVSVCADNVYM